MPSAIAFWTRRYCHECCAPLRLHGSVAFGRSQLMRGSRANAAEIVRAMPSRLVVSGAISGCTALQRTVQSYWH